MPWSREFDDPIPLPRPLITLQDAAAYMMKLPPKARQRAEWQTAGEAVIMAAEDRGPILHARIAVLQAINFAQPKPERSIRRKKARTFSIIRA